MSSDSLTKLRDLVDKVLKVTQTQDGKRFYYAQSSQAIEDLIKKYEETINPKTILILLDALEKSQDLLNEAMISISVMTSFEDCGCEVGNDGTSEFICGNHKLMNKFTDYANEIEAKLKEIE